MTLPLAKGYSRPSQAYSEGQHNGEVIGGHPDGQGPQHQEEGEDDVTAEGPVPRGVQEVVQALGAEG